MQFLFTYDAIREIKTRDTRENDKVCKYGKILPLIYKAYCFHEDLFATSLSNYLSKILIRDLFTLLNILNVFNF